MKIFSKDGLDKPMKKESLLLSIEEGLLEECPKIANLWIDILTVNDGYTINTQHDKRKLS